MGKRGSGLVVKKCQICGAEFKCRHDRPGKYCSRKCVGHASPHTSFKIVKNCENCKKEYTIKRYRESISRFCSPECRMLNMPKGINHPRWNNGISERPHSARKAIMELRKTIDSCQKCGSDYRLQGHHIIPYSERPDLTNVKENIIILCVYCHAKEHPKQANLILKGGVYGKG